MPDLLISQLPSLASIAATTELEGQTSGATETGKMTAAALAAFIAANLGANAIITGGTINGATIGATTPASGAFTTLSATTSLTTPFITNGGAELKLGFTSSNPSAVVTPISGAVNYVSLTGNSTGGNILFGAKGSDTKVSLEISAQGQRSMTQMETNSWFQAFLFGYAPYSNDTGTNGFLITAAQGSDPVRLVAANLANDSLAVTNIETEIGSLGTSAVVISTGASQSSLVPGDGTFAFTAGIRQARFLHKANADRTVDITGGYSSGTECSIATSGGGITIAPNSAVTTITGQAIVSGALHARGTATAGANTLGLGNNGSGQSEIRLYGPDTSNNGSGVVVTLRSGGTNAFTSMTFANNGDVSTGSNLTVSSGVLTTVGGATMHTTSTALTDVAGSDTGTLTNAPSAGNPTKWIAINDNGTTRKIPTWT